MELSIAKFWGRIKVITSHSALPRISFSCKVHRAFISVSICWKFANTLQVVQNIWFFLCCWNEWAGESCLHAYPTYLAKLLWGVGADSIVNVGTSCMITLIHLRLETNKMFSSSLLTKSDMYMNNKNFLFFTKSGKELKIHRHIDNKNNRYDDQSYNRIIKNFVQVYIYIYNAPYIYMYRHIQTHTHIYK